MADGQGQSVLLAEDVADDPVKRRSGEEERGIVGEFLDNTGDADVLVYSLYKSVFDLRKLLLANSFKMFEHRFELFLQRSLWVSFTEMLHLDAAAIKSTLWDSYDVNSDVYKGSVRVIQVLALTLDLMQLSEAKCQHLAMQSVPRNLPDNLKTLDLSHNLIQELTNISMSNLNKLEHLNIEHNHLETIDYGALHALVRLRSLNLASNRLHKHYLFHKGVLDSLQILKRLNVANNNLDGDMVRCYLSDITSLVHLDLSWNAIEILFSGMFDGVPRLIELDLSNNYIAEIERGTLDSLRYLRVLNLAFNAIGCISSFDLPQLHLLNLSSNSLKFFLSQKSHEFYQLRNLDLSRNNLMTFPILPQNNVVKHLNLSRNNIVDLYPLSNETEDNLEMTSWYGTVADLDFPSAAENAISHLTEIMDLDLSYNQLTSFPWQFLSHVSSLQNVNMAENCLWNVTDVSYPETSHRSNRNRITALRSLRTLDIHGNSIRYIPQGFFDSLPQIEKINLKNNDIRFCLPEEMDNSTEKVCTTFSGAYHLRYLSLQGNNIRHLPPDVFQHTPLYFLDLSDNIGLNIHEGALREVRQSLQIMSLRRNLMNDLETNLPCLKWLKTLDLSSNRLTSIPANLPCSSMERLNLQNNSMRLLGDRTVLTWMVGLNQVFVSGNSFDCCSVRWTDPLVSKINIVDLENTYCIYAQSNISVPLNNTNIASQYCRQHTTPSLLTIGIIILMVLLLLLILCLFTLGIRKACLARKSRRNKIASEISAQIQTMKSKGKQVCFTVSSKGTW
ncbi:transforming growth factor beta activator LRRC33-like [Leptodactylus fuscus]|uniref:transforming growth factor beta activator LRRC33-like n=1 Tax=Leptodactylus fuscus TaxID=238119 RepID=UPI003F4F3B37